MKTKLFVYVLIITTLLISACAPATPPATPIAVAPIASAPINQGTIPSLPPAPTASPYIENEYKEEQSHLAPSEEYNSPLVPQPAPLSTSAARPSGTQDEGMIGAVPLQNPYSDYPSDDTTFQNYGTNPMVNATRDHLSTFALDVDTASYTVARKYIQQGALPPVDSVRTEEFINFFDQGYNPPADVAFALYADGAPSPFMTRQNAYIVRFGVKGYDIPENQRSPLSLTFVIDISGSMNLDKRLGLVKRSLELLVNRLRADDTVAIVVFGTSARLQLPVTPGSQREQILNAIYSLRPEGSTNAGDGLRQGYQMAMKAYRSNSSNRVILCTDGVANTGITDPDEILSTVQGYVNKGITLTTLGFGMENFNDVLLESLADKGNGNYAYIDTLEESRRLFVDKLTSTLNVIAKDAKIQVDFNPDVVAAYRQIGYENRQLADRDFRNDSVDAGELGPGHTVTALYEVILRPGTEGRMATLQMRWKDPKSEKATEINGNLNSWDMKETFQEAEPRYQLAVAVAQFAEILRNSPYAEGQSLSNVGEIASSLRYKLGDDPDVTEFIQLVDQANRLSYNYEE